MFSIFRNTLFVLSVLPSLAWAQSPVTYAATVADLDTPGSWTPLQPFDSYTRVLPEPEPRPAPAAGLPNILVILCDDLGYGDTALTGHPVIETPVIDNLRTQGAFCISKTSMSASVMPPVRPATTPVWNTSTSRSAGS